MLVKVRRHRQACLARPLHARFPPDGVCPHHAFRHAGRPAGIQQQEIVAGSGDLQRGRIAICRQLLVGLGKRQHFLAADLHPDQHLREARAHALYFGGEIRVEEYDCRVRIVEDVD